MPPFLSRLAMPLAAAFLVLGSAPAIAATLTVDYPGCTNVLITGTAPNYTISCAQPPQTCAVNATPAAPNGNTTATLSVACTPAATTVTWEASRNCTAPTVNPNAPLTATVTEPGGRSCVYTATAKEGGSAGATVVWQSAGTAPPPPPPNAPSGCAIARTPGNGSLTAAGGAISMNASCTTGTVTNWVWRKNATGNWSTSQNATDTLPANTASAQVTYTYGVTACNGSACANEVTTTFTVAGATVATGLCAGVPNLQIVDMPANAGTLDTVQNGSFAADGMFVIRMTVPASLANGGQLRFVELVDQPAPRQLTLSTQPCDFRGFVPGSYSPIDPTGGTYPMWRVNGQTLSLDYRLGTNPFNYPILQPGQTYYFNVRNVNWVNGAPSCGGATCNGRFESQAN